MAYLLDYCRPGGDSSRREGKRSVIASSLDDDDEVDGTFPMDINEIPRGRYLWSPAGFSEAALSRHFGQLRDSPMPYFHTSTQFRLFRGGIDFRPMHTEQEWLSWPYMESFMQMRDLVGRFHSIGWRKVLEFQHDWNEAVIRQFYTTLEVRAQKEKLIWMTGTRKFKATFKVLAEAIGLSYRDIKRGTLVSELPRLQPGDVRGFHYQQPSMYGAQNDLRRIPRVIYEILRHTIMPSRGGNENALPWPYYEIVNAVLSGVRINLLDWLVSQMMECKRNVHAHLALQPYIMALVLRTVGDFCELCEVQH